MRLAAHWKLSIAGAATLLLATIPNGVEGRSLSYRMKPSEKSACFYAYIGPDIPLNKDFLQFYYSASDAKGTEIIYVDAVVTGPGGRELKSQQYQTHAEVNIQPKQHGDYALCISQHGHAMEINLDVDITLPPAPHSEGNKETEKLELTVGKLQHELSDLVHQMRYIKNRERRNLETVDSIEGWIFYVSLFEVLLIMGMSLLQVVILRTFFSGNKQRV